MTQFWSIDHLLLDDPLNSEIWERSPEEQDRIQPYRERWDIDSIGAQQAMRHPYRLPWVPDVLGRDWQSREAIIVVGSAYAPFISGGGREGLIEAKDYDGDSSARLSERFLKLVVQSHDYYRRLGEILGAVMPNPRLVALFDLCRIAFVRRGLNRDFGDDGVVKCAPDLFSTYADSETPSRWLWSRLVQSEASTVIALGTIAENGMLRLFARHLTGFSACDSHDPGIKCVPNLANRMWQSDYASRLRKIKDRELLGSPHWEVSGQLGAAGRRPKWRLSVIRHPTGSWGRADEHSARTNVRGNMVAPHSAVDATICGVDLCAPCSSTPRHPSVSAPLVHRPRSGMANRSRVIAMALVALTVALPALSGAQGWTEQNINGLRVLDRTGPGVRERAIELKYGWYIETSYIDARGLVTAMQFTAPQWQASDRIDFVRDTNDDRVMDMGWTWIVGRGWIPWTTPTDIGPYKTLSDQARSQYSANTGTMYQPLYFLYVTRADKMFETARQMMIRGPANVSDEGSKGRACCVRSPRDFLASTEQLSWRQARCPPAVTRACNATVVRWVAWCVDHEFGDRPSSAKDTKDKKLQRRFGRRV